MTYLNILNKKLTILFVLLTIITILGCSTDNNEKPETWEYYDEKGDRF